MRQVNNQIRKEIFERDNHTCRYCGNKEGPFHADHVYPYSKGGETSIENLVTACANCNTKKQNKIGLWPKPIGYFDVVQEGGFDWLSWMIIFNVYMSLILLGTLLK